MPRSRRSSRRTSSTRPTGSVPPSSITPTGPRPTPSPETAPRWCGSRSSPRSSSTCRNGDSMRAASPGIPTEWSSTSTRARGWGWPTARRSPGSCATSSRAWGSRRCRSRAGARASTSTRRWTGARRPTRCRRSRTSSLGPSRPTTPSWSSRACARRSAVDVCSSTGARTTARRRRSRRTPCAGGSVRRWRPRERGRSSTTPTCATSRRTRCSSAWHPVTTRSR